MPERRVVVWLKDGLHLRPAADFVRAAAAQPVRVTVARDGRQPVDARSMAAVTSLKVQQGEEVVLAAEGEGADAALDALAAFVSAGKQQAEPAAVEPAEPAAVEPAEPVAAAALSERSLRGTGASPGVAVGPLAVMGGALPEPPADAPAGEPTAEATVALGALEAVAADLEARGERAGGEARAVLAAQALLARDPALAAEVERLTAAGRTAARAVHQAFAAYIAELRGGARDSREGFYAARAADLEDVRNRAVARLLGVPLPGVPDPGHAFVLAARDLAPADTAGLDRAAVLAFVTEEGGPTSHTAILARAMGVPAVVACPGVTALPEGTRVLVDGASGEVLPDPDEEQVRRGERRAGALRAAHAEAERTAGPGATADGARVALLANLGAAGEAAAAVAAGAEGVGLLRTEFLFLDRAEPPGVEEQAAAYAPVFAAFPGGTVVVRTLDAGADKPLAFLSVRDEPNPALGRRGLRALRDHPEVLEAQLEAIARAAATADAEVRVMAPMVATAAEAAWFCERARRGPVAHAGVMVEIPAAALAAEALLAVADFASLGTNDLAQYLFAADRQGGALAAFQDPWQPALLRLAGEVAAAGRAAGKPVGVCGEAAGDPLLALVLTGLGVTSLSMAPAALAAVRLVLARHTLDQCRRLAELAVAAPDAEAARQRVRAAAAPGEAGP